MIHKHIAYIVGNFVDLRTPFITNEIKGVQKEGIDILVFLIHRTKGIEKWAEREKIRVMCVDSVLFPKVIMAHLYFFLRRPVEYCRILIKNRSCGGKRVFWESAYYAKTIRQLQINHVHAHFAWNAADCARIIKRLTGITFSLTAHQSDIHRMPVRLCEKLNEAKFVLTCTKGNREYLANKYGKAIDAKTFLVYHGVDVDKFSPEVGEDKKEIDILSIGDLVRVKGLEYLIEACLLLKRRGVPVNCCLIGEGEEKNDLQELIAKYNLNNEVFIKDPVKHDEIVRYYRKAKIFVLPITKVGNVAHHGIPNVIAEAMATGLPVVVFDVPDVNEIVENGKNGILVEDKNVSLLSGEIENLMRNEEKRISLGLAARKTMVNMFDKNYYVGEITKKLGGV